MNIVINVCLTSDWSDKWVKLVGGVSSLTLNISCDTNICRCTVKLQLCEIHGFWRKPGGNVIVVNQLWLLAYDNDKSNASVSIIQRNSITLWNLKIIEMANSMSPIFPANEHVQGIADKVSQLTIMKWYILLSNCRQVKCTLEERTGETFAIYKALTYRVSPFLLPPSRCMLLYQGIYNCIHGSN